jgi:HD-GYP domain-containing protein (c-di-GMP phosphodiesterase class II)
MSVSNRILEKRGPLTASEWEQVRLHAYQNERILVRSPVLASLAPLTGMHHERQNGSGYHRQAAGHAVPVSARILAAADVYQAVTQERPFRPALSSEGAADQLTAEVSQSRLDASSSLVSETASWTPSTESRSARSSSRLNGNKISSMLKLWNRD